jgi:hypothetical protein
MRISEFALSISLLTHSPRNCLHAAGILTADGYSDEIPVVSELNVDTLARNAVHRFFFRAGTSGTNRPYYIPVIVARYALD